MRAMFNTHTHTDKIELKISIDPEKIYAHIDPVPMIFLRSFT